MAPPIPARVHDFQGARARFGALADTMVEHLWIGDPAADEAIEALASLPHGSGTRSVDAALAGDRSVAEPLAGLIAHCKADPPWLQRDRVEIGARTYRRLGLGAVAILASVSLLRGYHSSAVNKPLVFAERLDRAARVRLGETGRFVHQVCAPGGLRPTGPGFASCVRVRLMHAQVRRRLLRSDRWDLAAWAVPINQTDLTATGISFSMAVLTAAREMGYRFTHAESEGLLHLWRYTTWLMGAPEALLWNTETEARRVGELISSTQPGADAWSRRLSDALRGVLIEVEREAPLPLRLPYGLWRRYLDALARDLNGDGIANDLGIPVHGSVLPLTRALVRPLERTRRLLPGGTRLAAAAGHQLIDRAMVQLLRGSEPRFERPREVPGVHSTEPIPEPGPPPPAFAGALFAYLRRGPA